MNPLTTTNMILFIVISLIYSHIHLIIIIIHAFIITSMSLYLIFRNLTPFSSARVPSIKFLGPRSLLQHQPQSHQSNQKAKPAQQPTTQKLTDLSQLPAMRIPSVRGVALSQLEMDIVNSGGWVDESSKKVKPIKIV